MKAKELLSRILFPPYRTLLYVLLSFLALGSLYGVLFFSLHNEELTIFSYYMIISNGVLNSQIKKSDMSKKMDKDSDFFEKLNLGNRIVIKEIKYEKI